MNHKPYGLAGSLSAKVKGFMGLPRSPNVVMRKVKGGYQVGIMPDGYNKVTFRPDKAKRAALQDVQVFKTEKATRKHMDKLLEGA
jgi:hypothetical protein|nr:MAG TPA: hypothetical protein [Caudoviricetes sp.]